MKKKYTILLIAACILFTVTLCHAAEEYEFLRKWTPDNNPRGLAVDKDGNIYAAGDRTVLKYSSSGTKLLEIKNIANNDDFSLNSWDMWVAVDDSGNIYISNQQDHNVVKFDSLGTYVTKWGTQGSGDAQFNEPQGIAVDSSGNVYVCDKQNRRILKFDSSGSLLTKWGTQGNGEGEFEGPKDLAVDSTNSEVYIMDEWQNPRRIQVFGLDGTYKRKWEMSTGDSQVNQPTGITLDSDGNAYICDASYQGTNKIVKFSSTGTYITHLGGGYGTDNSHYHGINDAAVDYSGKLYLFDQQWDGGDRRIMKFQLKGSPTVSITAPADNSFLTGTVPITASVDIASGYTLDTVEVYIDDTLLGPAAVAGLIRTSGFGITAATSYTIDWDTTANTNGSHTVWVYATNTEGTQTKEKLSVIVANGDDEPTVSITNPEANEEVRGAVTIQVTAADDNGISKVEFQIDGETAAEDSSSPYEYSWDTTAVTDDYYVIKAKAYDSIGQIKEDSLTVSVTNSEGYTFVESWAFDGNPTGLTLDTDRNLFVAGNHRVRKYNSEGLLLFEIEDNSSDYSLSWDMDVAVDSSGSIYVVSTNQNKIIKFNSSGNYVQKWGSLGSTSTAFDEPYGIAIDSADYLYICDSRNHRIVKYDTNGNYMGKWGTQGNGDGQFENPRGIAADSSDNIFVAEQWNHRVSVFDSSGTFLRKWGEHGSGDSNFWDPNGVALDSEDRVYVADSNNHRIVRWASAGTFQTKWGSQGSGEGELDYPRDVAVDSNGLVYVADSNNQRIMIFRSTWTPTVNITSPEDSATVIGEVTIQISAESGIGISKVEIYIDGTKVGEASAAGNFHATDLGTAAAEIYEYLWDSTSESDGSYEIKAKAYNTDEDTSETTISVIVNNGGEQPPKVAITSPTAGDTVRLQTTIQVSATNSTDTIDKVTFKIDGEEVGEDSASPYEYIWETSAVPDGEVEITATAYDTIGLYKSESITVNVVNSEEYNFVRKWSVANPRGIALDSSGNVYITGEHKIKKYDSEGNLLLTIEQEWDELDYQLTWSMYIAVDDSGYIYVTCSEQNQVVKFDPQGGYVSKWGSFGSGDTQFSNPQGIAIDSQGNLYICDNDNHRIVKYGSDGTFVTQWGSQGWNEDQFDCLSGVAVDSTDKIYVLDSCQNRVKVFDSSGTFLSSWGQGGSGDNEFQNPRGIATDSEDNVYIADEQNHRIVKLTSDGTFIAKWGSLGSGDLEFGNPQGVAVDSNGYVYVLDEHPNNRIIVFYSAWTPAVEITNPIDYSTVSSTVKVQAQITCDLEIDAVEVYIDGEKVGDAAVAGNFQLAEIFISSVQTYEYSWDTTGYDDGAHTITVKATNIQDNYREDVVHAVVNNGGDELPTVSLTNPVDGDTVSLSSTIEADVTDDNGITKVEIYIDGELEGEAAKVTSSAGTGFSTAAVSFSYEYEWDVSNLLDGEHGLKVVAFDTIGQNVSEEIKVTVDNNEAYEFSTKWSFDNPCGVAVDSEDNLYAAGGNKVSKYDSEGTQLFKILAPDNAEYRFEWEMHVTVDSSGNIYVSNPQNHKIMKFNSLGKFLIQWGGHGSNDGELSNPQGIAVDSENNIYVCDSDNHRICVFDSDGMFVDKWGSEGQEDNQFQRPVGIFLDASENIYVTESWSHRVKVFDSEKTFVAKWGEWGSEDTKFQDPQGITVGPEGYLYIADSNNHRIVKYNTEGNFRAKWGSWGSSDGEFDWPRDVAVDSSGLVYVADANNNRIAVFRSAWLPSIVLTNPADKAAVSGTVKIRANAQSGIGIKKVEVYIDGTIAGEAAAAAEITYTHEYSWDTEAESDGAYTIKLIAYNTQNKTAESEITVVVNNSNDEVPTVSITSPSEGDYVRRTVKITADASDKEGLAKVEFYAGETKLGEDISAPYEFSWDTTTLPDGEVEVTAAAVDAIGQKAESKVKVTIRNKDMYEYSFQWDTSWENNGYGFPNGITVDKYGFVYVAYHERIVIYTSKGTQLSVIENPGVGETKGITVTESDYQLTNDMRITVDDSGNIYVTCPNIQKVIKFDSDGNYVTKWGEYGSGDSQFTRPQGIATDSSGNVYVSDGWSHENQESNSRIIKFDSTGTYISQWGSKGGNDGQFENPIDIAIDSNNNCYVIDGWRNRVQAFDSSGNFVRSWGDWGYGDTKFQNPEGIGIDSEDNLFIADTGNHRIVKYGSDGTFKSKWGSQGQGDGEFDWPRSVAVSSTSYVYVADSNNQRIVVYQLKGLPTVEITSPVLDSTVNGTVHILGTASSSYGISEVEWYIDGVKKSSISSAVFSNGIRLAAVTDFDFDFSWDTTSYLNGSHDIKVIAYNSDLKTSTAETSVIANNGGDTAPTISISNLKDDAVVRGTVTIKAEAADDIGIDKVIFYADGTKLGEGVSSSNSELNTEADSYEYTWNTAETSDGKIEVKVEAVDTIGQKTWARVTVLVDNANRIFSINLNGAAVIFLTKDHKLKKLDENGNAGYVINENVRVSQFQFDPLGNLYIVFEQKQELQDGKQYIMVKADPKTSETEGIDSSLDGLVWLENSTTNNLQFDAAGNAYYFAHAQTGDGEEIVYQRVLRMYTDENNSEDLVNENIEIYHWQVTNDGTVVLAGKTRSNNETWLRKINPPGETPRVVNIAEPDWQWNWGWMAKFPDDRVYMTLNGSFLNLDGIYKLPADLSRMVQADSDAPYIGTQAGASYNQNTLLEGHSAEYIKGITENGWVREMINLETDSANNVFGLAGQRQAKYRTVIKLYPVPEIIEPKLISRAQLMTVSLDDLVIAGFDNTTGKYKLLVYNTSTRNEIDVMYQNIELYHLGVIHNGSILFDGLNLDTNKVVIGMFERAAGSAGKMSITADDYTYKTLTEIGGEADKPLGFGVITEGSTDNQILSVSITSPTHGSTVAGTVTLKATATAEKGVSKVEFSIDDTKVGEDAESPYEYSWNTENETDGDHILKAIVYDTENQTATSQNTVKVSNGAPSISVSTATLCYGATTAGASTPEQEVRISNSGSGTLDWSIADNAEWLTCSPASGTGSAVLKATANHSTLPVGTYTANITITSTSADNSPQTIQVTLSVLNPGDTTQPFGSFDTPIDGTAGITGAVPVTGWVVDDIGVESVKIYRDPIDGEETEELIYIGDAGFVEGARRDVEGAYPDYPESIQAGWGYMILTNFLPNQGNGTYRLHAIAIDRDGHQVSLGTKTIHCDNNGAVKPFGTIDTPAQGGTVSGQIWNAGWALTPQACIVPIDGSTLWVWVDGVRLTGHPAYNQYRDDIATLFPGLRNTDGAVGAYLLDTSLWINGVHTIFWTVTDDCGRTEGLGSRFFTIMNAGATAQTQETKKRIPQAAIEYLPESFELVRYRSGYSENEEFELAGTDEYGMPTVAVRETDRVEIDLGKGSDFEGYIALGEKLYPLPIGSTLDSEKGVFIWQLGPGFIGDYEFVFIKKAPQGMVKLRTKIQVVPKFSLYTLRQTEAEQDKLDRI